MARGELTPRITIDVELDGDDDASMQLGNAVNEIERFLNQLVDNGYLLGFEVTTDQDIQ